MTEMTVIEAPATLRRPVDLTGTRRLAALTALFSGIAFALIVMRAELRYIPLNSGMDDWKYSRIAAGFPIADIPAPFRNRPLIPTIAGLLPGPVPWGFAVVTAVLLGAAWAGLDRILRQLVGRRAAWAGLAMMFTISGVAWMLSVPMYIDSAVLAAAVFGLLFLLEGRWKALLILVPVAAAAHEMTLLLLIPIVVEARRTRRWGDAVALVGLGLGVWFVLHRSGMIIPANDRGTLLDADYRQGMVDYNVNRWGGLGSALVRNLEEGLGIVGLLAPFGILRSHRIVRSYLFVLPCCFLLFFQAADWFRLFLVPLPALVVAACTYIAGRYPM